MGLRMKVTLAAIFIICIGLAGRLLAPTVPDANGTPTASTGLPNLKISMMFYQIETGDACLTSDNISGFGVGVWVTNTGTDDAGPFDVVVNGLSQTVEGLAAGESIRVWFSTGSEANVQVDSTNAIAESDETDNSREQRLPIPTLPMMCTSTPTPEATTPAPNGGLPDLRVSSMSYELETDGSCVDSRGMGFMGVGVIIGNLGEGDAGKFSVWLDGTEQVVTQGLAANQYVRLWFPTGSSNVMVDPANEVWESDEANNTRVEERLPIPTLPVACIGTSTPLTLTMDVKTLVAETYARLIGSDAETLNMYCQVGDSGFHCDLAAGHSTSVSFSPIETPLDPADPHYRLFRYSPMLIWDEQAAMGGPNAKEHNIIWQIAGQEIHITSFDDTGIPIALDPLLVAETIYQVISRG